MSHSVITKRAQHLQSNAWKAMWVQPGMSLIQSMSFLFDMPHGFLLQVALQIAVAQLVDGVIVLQSNLFISVCPNHIWLCLEKLITSCCLAHSLAYVM